MNPNLGCRIIPDLSTIIYIRHNSLTIILILAGKASYDFPFSHPYRYEKPAGLFQQKLSLFPQILIKKAYLCISKSPDTIIISFPDVIFSKKLIGYRWIPLHTCRASDGQE
jgi:hypothetical protein